MSLDQVGRTVTLRSNATTQAVISIERLISVHPSAVIGRIKPPKMPRALRHKFAQHSLVLGYEFLLFTLHVC